MASSTGNVAGGAEHRDTDAEAERVQMDILRALPVWQRLAQVDQIYELTTALALADLRRRHPLASDADLRRLLAERRRADVAPASDRA